MMVILSSSPCIVCWDSPFLTDLTCCFVGISCARVCALPVSLPHSIQVSLTSCLPPAGSTCPDVAMGCLEIVSSRTRLALYRNCLVILGPSHLISSFHSFVCPPPPQILVFLFQKLQRYKCQSSGAVTVQVFLFCAFPFLPWGFLTCFLGWETVMT